MHLNSTVRSISDLLETEVWYKTGAFAPIGAFGPLKVLGLPCYALRPRTFCVLKVKNRSIRINAMSRVFEL